ncbi:hypothetical protein [Lentzea sp. NEAU-D7]|nr:hypothetical protein [Lentzea sp. NEAU-D7]MCX2951113.1 hypothetical protein [Lentzea sp. NEAU-D7]
MNNRVPRRTTGSSTQRRLTAATIVSTAVQPAIAGPATRQVSA